MPHTCDLRLYPVLSQAALGSGVAVLRAVKYRCHDDSIAWSVDLVHNDIGQSRHAPFVCIGVVPDVPQERKRGQQLNACEQSIRDFPSSRRTVLRDPIEDALEIGNRLVVEDKLHRSLRAEALYSRG